MATTEIVTPTQGTVGWLHEVECAANDSILIFQLPRHTQHLSSTYLEMAKDSIISMLPPGRSAIIMGCDINVYELCGADAVILKLKGLI
jgi:hypothetical protein